MQFQIPQFIDNEAKIVGPLTIKQFIIIAAAIGVSFMLFYIFQIWLWFLFTTILVGGSVVLALVKVNGQTLTTIALGAIKFYWKPKLYIWKKEEMYTTERQRDQETKRPKKSLISSLQEKLMTTKVPIPKRETSAKSPKWQSIFGIREKFEILHKITGDKEVARRVDYR